MRGFSKSTADWFASTFDAATPVQTDGWRSIADGKHSLLLAPTGSGKTLAAFLWSIDRCMRLDPESDVAGVRVLYISPLKALAYDVERNLRAPLIGIKRAAERLGEGMFDPAVFVRTGDTTQKARRDFAKRPAEILVTTPESLYLILGSAARETLRTVETVIIDEIHALAPTKRGAHLALSLERLEALTAEPPQRIGLSATARPVELVANFLGGDRDVAIVDTSEPPSMELELVVPVPDMTNPPVPQPRVDDDDAPSGSILGAIARQNEPRAKPGIWPSVYDELLAAILSHRTTIVFVNSRGLCERLAHRLNEQAKAASETGGAQIVGDLVRAHHGSIAHGRRKETEELLKSGNIRAIVATSSLELGIDMAAVDHVILVESPGSVASGLQRIGRSGHGVGEVSKGTLFPKHRGDLLESAVVAQRMRGGQIEPLRLPKNALDVLAQQIVAAVSMEDWALDDLAALLRRAAGYAGLSQDVLAGVLDMLSGKYPSTEFADLRPRLVWDRAADTLSARRGAKRIAIISGGTIPDRGLYTVHMGPDGPRVGELDEEMVHETRAGEVIALGATSWRVLEITRERVIVAPAPGEPARLPFWHGEGPGRPIELGRAMGEFVRELGAMEPAGAKSTLMSSFDLNEFAADNLVAYLGEQREVTGTLPTDKSITIERFRDELGDWRVCILSPFGARVHAPWAMAIETLMSSRAGFDVQTLYSDDGIVLRFVDTDVVPDIDVLVPNPEEVESLIVEQLGHSALFASHFRENASRSLLLPRRYPGSRTPLWAQRLKSQNLLAVAREFPAFPIVLETYRQCLQDVFDLPALQELLRDIRARRVRLEEVETSSASPFARGLVFAFVAAYLYEGDMPLAERRAQALTLDRRMLNELLGHEELRELLDLEVIDDLVAELQRVADHWRARHPDELHDVLRWVGDLSEEELVLRTVVDAEEAARWLAELAQTRRVSKVRVAGRDRWIASEDLAVYRDALGVSPPVGSPDAFLHPALRPLETLISRFARTHGPFHARDAARRWGIDAAEVEAILDDLLRRERVLRGDFIPGGFEPEWCHPEVLRSLRQRTLARLRNEVAPVEQQVLARFIPQWHGIDDPGAGMARLEVVLGQLEGVPLPFSDLERAILPARLRSYHPRMLDEAGSTGRFVWVGHSPLSKRDGRISIYRRERIALLRDPPEDYSPPTPLHRAVWDCLAQRGACFLHELLRVEGIRGQPDEAVRSALWDMAWAGLVTNDTFHPLRRLGSTGRRGRFARNSGRVVEGRWSLLRNLWFNEPEATERMHATAMLLLERHGIVGRTAVAAEGVKGGFTGVYRILRALEERGKVRRGYFVEGLGGAQFALAGAVDRLRACRRPNDELPVHVLAAMDPANPFGALLPWPEAAPDGAALRRSPGARVVIVDGELAMYASKDGRQLTTFEAMSDERSASLAIRALYQSANRGAKRKFRVEHINGEPARSSDWLERFREAGFSADHRALTA